MQPEMKTFQRNIIGIWICKQIIHEEKLLALDYASLKNDFHFWKQKGNSMVVCFLYSVTKFAFCISYMWQLKLKLFVYFPELETYVSTTFNFSKYV